MQLSLKCLTILFVVAVTCMIEFLEWRERRLHDKEVSRLKQRRYSVQELTNPDQILNFWFILEREARQERLNPPLPLPAVFYETGWEIYIYTDPYGNVVLRVPKDPSRSPTALAVLKVFMDE